jgi:eukaryotic-like serine/threonine-protein kinase
MANTPAPAANLDLFLGKMAVDWGLVTPEQLRQALTEQSRDVEEGRIPVRRLGEILIAQGLITKNHLDALLDAQRNRSADPAAAFVQDMRLGQLLIEKGLVTPRQVNECQRLQAETLEAGHQPVATLGELLVQKGFTTQETIRSIFETPQRTTLVCVMCGKRYPVTGYDPTKAYRCRDCKGDLVNTVGMLEDSPEDTGLILPFAGVSPIQKISGNTSSRVPPPSSGSNAAAGGRGAAVVPAPVPFGKYLLMREIGRGGMAVVYEAKDTTLDRKVALKMMIDNPYQDPSESAQDEERFLREARFCASLAKHPNIVGVFEAGVMEGKRYIVMELIDGYPMSRWRRMGSLSVRQQVAMLRDVSLAVHFAHENGVIHRDLKPQNILVDEERRPHITDFGLAKAVGDNVSASLTAPRMTVGTPQYMSPEQAKGLKSVDRRTDIWSLGIMLYEVLTGRPPFTGVTPIEILMKVVNNAVPPPSQVLRGGHPALDKSIESICMKALAKDPRDRYPTAKTLAEDLSRWIKGEEVSPVEASPGLKLPKIDLPPWLSRALPAASAVAILLVVVWSLLSSSGDDPLPRDLERAEQFVRESDYRTAYAAYSLILNRNPSCREALSGKQKTKQKLDEAGEAEKVRTREEAKREAETWAQERIEKYRLETEDAKTAAERSRRQAEVFAGRPFLSLSGHTNIILAVAFSADGKTLASSSFDNSIRLWEISTGHVTRTLPTPNGSVLSLAFSPDGTHLVTGGADKSVRVWTVATGETMHLLAGHAAPVTSVAWSPNGKLLASAGMDRLVRIWDAASGGSVHILGGHADAVWAVAFSPDGRMLASAGADKVIRLWDTGTGQEVRVLKGHTGSVCAVAFHPKVPMLVSGADDRMIMLWDTTNGTDLRTMPGHAEGIRCVAFSPDGRTIASGSRDKTIKMWDATSGACVRSLVNHSAGIRSVAFNNDGSVMASGAGDLKIEADGRISIWGNSDNIIRFWGSK